MHASQDLSISLPLIMREDRALLREQSVPSDRELFYNLVTRDALLIHGGVAHSLAGPFQSREDAERAAEALISQLREAETGKDSGSPSPDPAFR